MTEDCGCEHEYVNGEGCHIIWCPLHTMVADLEKTLMVLAEAFPAFPQYLLAQIEFKRAHADTQSQEAAPWG